MVDGAALPLLKPVSNKISCVVVSSEHLCVLSAHDVLESTHGDVLGSRRGLFPRVILAYTCVKPLVRLYVCQRVGPFWVHFGSILGPFWVHSWSILGPFWVQFGSNLGPVWVQFGNILDTDASLVNQCLDKNQYLDENQYLDKNHLLNKSTL